MSDYLFDKEGAPDPEIERLEGLLAPMAYRGAPPALPRPRRRAPMFVVAAAGIALAAALVAVLIARPWRPGPSRSSRSRRADRVSRPSRRCSCSGRRWSCTTRRASASSGRRCGRRTDPSRRAAAYREPVVTGPLTTPRPLEPGGARSSSQPDATTSTARATTTITATMT